MKTWQMRWFLVAVLATLGCVSPTLARADFKLGVDEVLLSGATYTHDNGITPLRTLKDMVGTQVSLEFLPTLFFGLEVAYSLSPLERTYQLGPNGATSNNVTEQASYVTYGANFYLLRGERGPEQGHGLHPMIGVATGTLDVTQKFEGGTLGSISTHNSVDINILKLGLEWVATQAGVRLQYQIWSGQTSNTTKIAGIRQTNDYTGAAGSVGVFKQF